MKGLKNYQQIIDDINSMILANPKSLQKEIERIESEIEIINQELRDTELELKYGHTIHKRLELDFFTNTVKYQEVAPDGEILIEKSRGLKPRDFKEQREM